MAYIWNISKLLRSRLFVLFCAALVVMVVTSPAAAHSVELLRSDPPAGAVLPVSPAKVTAWFNEEAETSESWIRVFDATGKQVDAGDGGVDLTDAEHASMLVSVPEGLPEGSYEVRWRVVLLDGDPTEGQFNFFVGAKGAAEATAIASAPQATPVEPQDEAGSGSPLIVAGSIVLVVAILGLVGLRVMGRKRV